ncbi:MAG: nucleotidyltransferase domain-containing protein [Deferribacteres bacterium]|nr:nucleotidyltransferase domain-containing protein [Deferribacteres bacterium]
MPRVIHNKLASHSEIMALEKITSALSGVTGVKRIYFFGSRRRGDFRGSSDMDLLLVIDSISLKDRIIHILHEIELEYDVPISPVIFTSSEYAMNRKLNSSFIRNVEREGILLYDAEDRGQN